jgi:hypothetical protein
VAASPHYHGDKSDENGEASILADIKEIAMRDAWLWNYFFLLLSLEVKTDNKQGML